MAVGSMIQPGIPDDQRNMIEGGGGNDAFHGQRNQWRYVRWMTHKRNIGMIQRHNGIATWRVRIEMHNC